MIFSVSGVTVLFPVYAEPKNTMTIDLCTPACNEVVQCIICTANTSSCVKTTSLGTVAGGNE